MSPLLIFLIGAAAGFATRGVLAVLYERRRPHALTKDDLRPLRDAIDKLDGEIHGRPHPRPR